MKYNFDEYLDRSKSNSIKWIVPPKYLGDDDIIPMWVADMDFKAPKPVIDALKHRIDNGDFGYGSTPESAYDSIINWCKDRYDWHIKKEWILFTTGVVPGLSFSVNAFTKPGDKVIVQTPVYYPFFSAVEDNGRRMIVNELKLEDGKYYMDTEDLIKQIDIRTKAIILCSPHNPVGRVWKRSEIEKLVNICVEKNITIISDEIHADVVYSGYKHIPTASISPQAAKQTITFIAPSKTFNLAGLITSIAIIPDHLLRERFKITLENAGVLYTRNILGVLAMEEAYTHGLDWLLQVLSYMEENIRFMTDFFEKHLPKIKVIKPEATYIVWLDCRELGLSNEQLKKILIEDAKVLLSDGLQFGKGGDGFQRINIAYPRFMLEKALLRMEKALKSL